MKSMCASGCNYTRVQRGLSGPPFDSSPSPPLILSVLEDLNIVTNMHKPQHCNKHVYTGPQTCAGSTRDPQESSFRLGPRQGATCKALIGSRDQS